MAPTATQASSVNSEKRLNSTERPSERKQELICRVKYGNTLPDIPFDLKFLHYPFDNQRFVKYNPTSLERNYKYDVLMEHDLGVTIDLINRDLYQADPYAQLDPADERILEEDVHAPQDSIRSRQHSRSVSWLRKSEYISTEQTRFQPQNLENIEAKVGYNVKKSLRGETLYLDREAQIKAIEKTFLDSKQEITKHFSKPNVVPVEVLHIHPDYENWKYPCAQVIFDSDPAPVGKNVPAQIEEMSQAMIRGVMDESGEQFVAYFLPTEKTLEKRRLDVADKVLYRDGEDYEYRIAREYNWNVKSKASKGYEENYFFVLTSDGVYYNELETRVRLNKRRVKVGQQTNNTKLIIKHRPLDVHEHRMQRNREKQLEPACDDDEEEMDVNDTERIVKSEPNKLGNKDEMTDNAVAAQNQSERDSILRSRSNSLNSSPRRSGQSGSDLPASSHSRSRSRSAHSHTSSGTRSTSQSSNEGSNDSRSSHKSSSSSGFKVDKESGSDNNENGRSPSLSSNNSPHSSRADSRANSESKSPRRSVSRSSSDTSEGSPSESENEVA